MSNVVLVAIFLASFALALGLVRALSALIDRNTSLRGLPVSADPPDTGRPSGQNSWRM